jgi:hypothetical protein
MTPFESHLWHLPCEFRGAIKQQSRHSKSLLDELKVFRFQYGGETIGLLRRENERWQFWISFSGEYSGFLPDFILLDLCRCFAVSSRPIQSYFSSSPANIS